MIKSYRNTLQQPKLKKFLDIQASSWVNVIDPSTSELELLAKKTNLPIEAFEDSLDEHELPRVKIQNENVFIILRLAEQINGKYITTPLTIILNKQFVTTIATKKLVIIDELINQKIDFVTTQQSNFFIKVSLRIIEHYQAYITTISRKVQSTKSDINDIDRSDIVSLIEIEEILNKFITSLSPTINTIEKILKHSYIDLYSQDKELIDDLLVDGEQVREFCITNLKTIKNIRDGYTTILTINLNQIIKILTYITVFFTVPMIVASVYGMNIPLPFSDSPYAFLIVSLATLGLLSLVVLFFFVFRKRL